MIIISCTKTAQTTQSPNGAISTFRKGETNEFLQSLPSLCTAYYVHTAEHKFIQSKSNSSVHITDALGLNQHISQTHCIYAVIVTRLTNTFLSFLNGFYTEVTGLFFVNVFLMEFVKVFLNMCQYLPLHSDMCLFLPFILLASKQQVFTDTLLVSNGGGNTVFINRIHIFEDCFNLSVTIYKELQHKGNTQKALHMSCISIRVIKWSCMLGCIRDTMSNRKLNDNCG